MSVDFSPYLNNLNFHFTLNQYNNILLPISKQPIHFVDPIFEYKYIVNKDDGYMSVWLLSFYSKIYFLGFTIPLNKKA